MSTTRRNFVLTSVAAMAAAGCATEKVSNLPGVYWPELAQPDAPQIPLIPGQPRPVTPLPPSTLPTGLGTASNPIPRAQWTSAQPIMADINPMNGIDRITMHHEGWQLVDFSDTATTARRLEQIRNSHVGTRHWSDIAYHYVIDRAGRVWEGRNIRFQGAHVKDKNPHNLGVMCLGNFDIQSPSDAQLTSLRDTVRFFRRKYNIQPTNLFTHQEIGHTSCPGKNLQPKIVAMRNNKSFT